KLLRIACPGEQEEELESACHLHSDSNSRHYLRDLQRFPPFESAAQCLAGHYDHVAGLHGRIERSSGEYSFGASGHASIRANNKDILPVGNHSRPACLAQIPMCALSRTERNACAVVNRSLHHHEVGLFRNKNGIACPKLNISRSMYPGLTIADMNHQPPNSGSSLQFLKRITPLQG